MNNIIYTEPNLLLESYSVLTQLANPDAEFNVRKAFSTVTHFTPEKEALFTKILTYFDTIESKLTLSRDRVDFFFKIAGNTITSESKGHMLLKICLQYDDLDQLLVAVKNFTVGERFEHLRVSFVDVISSDPELLTLFAKSITQESELFSAIFDNKDLSDTQKYELFYIYYHYELLLEEFISLIQQTSKVITPLLTDFQTEVDHVVETITPLLETKGMDYFNDAFGITLGKDSNYKFYPCITSPLTMSFTNIHGTMDAFDIFFGIYVFPFMALNPQVGTTDKELASFLKALADPTKFQILKLIKTERLYASQLAEKLSVSNATISHHMNTLMQLGIIKYEKEQNRFYYSLEKEKFKNYLIYLNQSFEVE